MANYLLIDFGSTFTKLTAVSTEAQDIIGTSSHFTTVQTDIAVGYHHALDKLTESMGQKLVFDEVIACSSAAGGLKMAAIGLIEELTVEAAKRVCLGAGAKVDLVFAHHLTKHEVKMITDLKIDIILLAGGADGGNTECVLFNAKLLGEMGIKIPILFAGNKSCQDEILAIFAEYNMDGHITENVMPRINQLNIKPAREKIRDLFLEKIIEAKGIKQIESEIDKVILPTPQAVLQAAELLAKGYLNEPGIGELVMVDIGGATTDMYSMSNPTRRSDVILQGLEEPFAKRTVEGDLGMRYSAQGVLKSLTKDEIALINAEKNIDIEKDVRYRAQHIDAIPETNYEHNVDQILAEMCAYKAMSRHAGKMEEVYTPMGMCYNQIGKDLTEVEFVIGTGGAIIKSRHPQEILAKVTNLFRNRMELRPTHPHYLLDKDYIMSAMGLLSQNHPLLALKIMKKRLVQL